MGQAENFGCRSPLSTEAELNEISTYPHELERRRASGHHLYPVRCPPRAFRQAAALRQGLSALLSGSYPTPPTKGSLFDADVDLV